MHNDRSPCCTLPFTLLGGAGFAESLFLMINRWHELGIELPTLPTSVVSAWAPAARVWGRDTRGGGSRERQVPAALLLSSDLCRRSEGEVASSSGNGWELPAYTGFENSI